MSEDYYLFSRKANKAVMVGSMGLNGTKSWPVEYGGREFIKWALDNFVTDIQMVSENALPEDCEDVSRFRETT